MTYALSWSAAFVSDMLLRGTICASGSSVSTLTTCLLPLGAVEKRCVFDMLSEMQDFWRLYIDSMGFCHVQAAAQVKRRLAALELDMDRQQGWVRGGSKSEVIWAALLYPFACTFCSSFRI